MGAHFRGSNASKQDWMLVSSLLIRSPSCIPFSRLYRYSLAFQQGLLSS